MRTTSALAAAFTLGALCAPALAAPILDQRYEPMSTNVSAVVGINESPSVYHIAWAQTFTVGIAGQLTSIEALVRGKQENTEPLLIDIRTAPGGVPTEADAGANVLASISVPANQVGFSGFQSFDFSAFNLQVAVGDRLAIVMRSEAPTVSLSYEWDGRNGNDFIDGAAWPRTTSTFSTNGLDLGFRTYVDTVPAPGAAVAIGVCGLIRSRRRRP